MTSAFKGVVNVDIRDSEADWAPFEPPKAPDGAPNVLYIVLDDVGFSALEPTVGRSRRRTSIGSSTPACATRNSTPRRCARRRGPVCSQAATTRATAWPASLRPRAGFRTRAARYLRRTGCCPRSSARRAGTRTWSASGICEADALAVHPAQRVRTHLAAERVRQARTRVIDQDDQDVRRVLREMTLPHPVLIGGLLHRPPGATGGRRRRKRKHILRLHRHGIPLRRRARAAVIGAATTRIASRIHGEEPREPDRPWAAVNDRDRCRDAGGICWSYRAPSPTLHHC
jgi:hypothetical protein